MGISDGILAVPRNRKLSEFHSEPIGILELAVGIREIAAADGVPFTATGYEKIADTVFACSKNLTVKSEISTVPSLSASQKPGKQRSFYWRHGRMNYKDTKPYTSAFL